MKQHCGRWTPIWWCGLAIVALGWPALAGTELAGTVQPSVATSEYIGQQILRLGDEDYFVRDRAHKELSRMGFEAFDALSQAEQHDDLEIALRARYLLRQLKVVWTEEADAPEAKALMRGYDTSEERVRLEIIRQLAHLPDDKGVPALCRLARFETTLPLAKYAALALVGQDVRAEAWPARRDSITALLGDSNRSAVTWIRAYLEQHEDPSALADRWSELAAGEADALAEQPQHSRPDLVAALWRQRVVLLKQLDRREDALAAMFKVVELEQGSDETLADLSNWLLQQQDFAVVKDVAAKFPDRFTRNPVLMYMLATAQEATGQPAEAEQTAAVALGIGETNADEHYPVVLELQRYGLVKWLERELRNMIEFGTPGDPYTLASQSTLAELHYDRNEFAAAAEIKKAEATAMDKNAEDGQTEQNLGIEPRTVHARYHYFLACQALVDGDRPGHIRELESGLVHDPHDTEILIALYRVPNLEAPLAQRTRELIKSSAEEMRQEIRNDPERPLYYNQLAWLISNTEGDFKEALEHSQRSLELRPNTAGFLDTLARCHFALGEVAKAVEVQTSAVKLDPNSQQMARQLAEFQKALSATPQTQGSPP